MVAQRHGVPSSPDGCILAQSHPTRIGESDACLAPRTPDGDVLLTLLLASNGKGRRATCMRMALGQAGEVRQVLGILMRIAARHSQLNVTQGPADLLLARTLPRHLRGKEAPEIVQRRPLKTCPLRHSVGRVLAVPQRLGLLVCRALRERRGAGALSSGSSRGNAGRYVDTGTTTQGGAHAMTSSPSRQVNRTESPATGATQFGPRRQQAARVRLGVGHSGTSITTPTVRTAVISAAGQLPPSVQPERVAH